MRVGDQEVRMKRFLMLGYGAGCYLVFWGVRLFDRFRRQPRRPAERRSRVAAPAAEALLVNLLLLGLFAAQHSVMARPWFKAVVDPAGARAHRTQYIRAHDDLVRAAVLAVADDAGDRLGRHLGPGAGGVVDVVRPGVGNRPAVDFPDQPLRSVRVATGVPWPGARRLTGTWAFAPRCFTGRCATRSCWVSSSRSGRRPR